MINISLNLIPIMFQYHMMSKFQYHNTSPYYLPLKSSFMKSLFVIYFLIFPNISIIVYVLDRFENVVFCICCVYCAESQVFHHQQGHQHITLDQATPSVHSRITTLILCILTSFFRAVKLLYRYTKPLLYSQRKRYNSMRYRIVQNYR